MKRDMDLVRKIILAVRDSDRTVTAIPDVERETFAMHAQLLSEAGLITADFEPEDHKRAATSAHIYRLTWEGQEFADAILSDTVWEKAKENVLKPAASWTFAILLDYLKFEIRRHVPGLDALP